MSLQSLLLICICGLAESQGFYSNAVDPQSPTNSPSFYLIGIANPANLPMTSLAPRVTETKYTGCSNVDSVGSSILLVNQVHTVINEIMSQSNASTFIQFIYYNKEEIKGKFSTIHTMIFKISDYGAAWFIGLKLDNHTSGIGSAKFLKVILNPSLQIVSKVLGLAPKSQIDQGFRCGDLKMIFNTFGNDGGVVGNRPGANRNRIPPGLLEQLKQLKPTPTHNIVRSCEQYLFVKSSNFYFSPISNTDTRPTVPLPQNTANTFEIARCSPEGYAIIDAIELDCQSDTPSPFNAKLVSIRIFYKIPFKNEIEVTQVFGKTTDAAPGNFSYKDKISLSNIGLITVHYLPNSAIAFRFFSKQRAQTLAATFNCGNTLGFTAGQSNDSVTTENLLGFWGTVGGPDSRIRMLGLIKFSSA